MGIPSYFSYIIKNFSNIIRSLRHLKTANVKIHRLYMDCNSIIYDAFRSIEDSDKMNVYQLEELIINNVISKIGEYVEMVSPASLTYVAFDGVAPLAKMEQQRNRRYKNAPTHNAGWSTSNITPGTEFMKKISARLRKHYESSPRGSVIISPSDEHGEGEHKIFQHIRDSPISPGENVAVYGLDSDLIMLSVFHCSPFQNFYIFREAPEFIKSSITLPDGDKSSCYFMDVKALSNSILSEMQCGLADRQRIYDYVFLCFFLGNDFLPHFPSLNIRTHGISALLEIYRMYIGKHPDRFFIAKDKMSIQWKWVNLFIKELAKREHGYILQEYDLRRKWDKRQWLTGTEDERDVLVQSVPVIYRAEEEYICPTEKGWENRYYKCLFGEKEKVESVCVNYLEGLEWVFKYYTVECPHWRWKYNYNYPPLLKDLCSHVPSTDHSFIKSNDKNNRPFKQTTQLAYVLPMSSHSLLSSKIRDNLIKHDFDIYPSTYSYKWAFCRYLWEAHAELPEIPMGTVLRWEKCF